MSSASAAEAQPDSSGLSKEHGDAAEEGTRCSESICMLPKALTVSPTDLFPEEQFESSDSEDDAELHAFTQRLDADWRSNLSQALSWNANLPGAVMSTSNVDVKVIGRENFDLASAGLMDPGLGSVLSAEAVDTLCHNVEATMSLSQVSTTENTRPNDGQTLPKDEVQSARPLVRSKPRFKAREAAHVLTARSKQARAARAAARHKHAQGNQESSDPSGAGAVTAAATPQSGPVKSESTSLLQPTVLDLSFAARQDGRYAVSTPDSVTVFHDDAKPSSAPPDVSGPQASPLAPAQHGRPLAKQHRCSSAHTSSIVQQPLPLAGSSPRNSPGAPDIAQGHAAFTSTTSLQTSTPRMCPKLQLPTPQPARGPAAVPISLPGSDPLPQTEFSPPVRGPVFHAGMAQRHPAITTRYRAKRCSETPKSSPVSYTGTGASPFANQAGSPLQSRTGFPAGLPTLPSAPPQHPAGQSITARAVQGTGHHAPQWAPPLPLQSPFSMAKYAVPAYGAPGPVHALAAPTSQAGMVTANDHKPSSGLPGNTSSKQHPSQPVPVDPAVAADCAAQLRAAALAQYILSTAPTLMPTVFGHMSADAVAQALPALASASGLLSASMSRPANTADGTKAADLLSQVKKRYPSLQVPADLVTSARNDTQQARADKRKEEDSAGNTKSAKGKKKSAKKTKSKKAPEDVDMQGTMLAVLEELLPGDVMLSLDGSHITFEAVLKPKQSAAGMGDALASCNATATVEPSTAALVSRDTPCHPMAFVPPVPAQGYVASAIHAPAMAYSMVAPLPLAGAMPPNDHAAQGCVPLSVGGGMPKGSPVPYFGTDTQASSTIEFAPGYIPSCTRPYGLTIDELIVAWPVREWCAAPSRAQLEQLVLQCQGLTMQRGKRAAPTPTEFGLPAEQLVYALAMLANWDCARVYQVLTTVNVDFRAIALRLPQAGLWFRCQPSAAEGQLHSVIASASQSSPVIAPAPSCSDTHVIDVLSGASQPAPEVPQPDMTTDMHRTHQARQGSRQVATHDNILQDIMQRRAEDCTAVKDILEGVLQHLGMSSELQVVQKESAADEPAAKKSTSRYSNDALQWPESTVWTRCLGALDCLQVRYMQRPSSEHLLPAASRPVDVPGGLARLVPQDRPDVIPEPHVSPPHDQAGSAEGNAIDATQSFGSPSPYDNKMLLQQPGFVQARAPVGSLLPNGCSDQKQNRNEAADSECCVM